MSKLTETQLRILSKASQRSDHAVDPPPRLRGAALKRTIGPLLSQGFLKEVAAGSRVPSWRRDGARGTFSLIITTAGLAAIGRGAPGGKRRPARAPLLSGRHTRRAHDPSGRTEGRSAPDLRLRSGTKLDRVCALLARPHGATIDTLMQTTGWKPHTIRAALSRLRKRGYRIARQKSKSGASAYRLTRAASPVGTARSGAARSRAAGSGRP